jgi:hypothetical protein
MAAMSEQSEPVDRTSLGGGNWVRRHPWLSVLGVLVVVVIVWSVWDSQRADGRQDEGYSACEDAVRGELISGYDPELSVTFEEKQPNGALAYSVLSDDGDGQWTCTVSKAGTPLTTDIVNGLVYD